MLGAVPSFPPIDTWTKMSESEQDALIQAMEASRRRRSRLAIAIACLGLCASITVIGCYWGVMPIALTSLPKWATSLAITVAKASGVL